jgi:hypothetical protein
MLGFCFKERPVGMLSHSALYVLASGKNNIFFPSLMKPVSIYYLPRSRKLVKYRKLNGGTRIFRISILSPQCHPSTLLVISITAE